MHIHYLECIHFIETANWAEESEVAHIPNGVPMMLFVVHLNRECKQVSFILKATDDRVGPVAQSV